MKCATRLQHGVYAAPGAHTVGFVHPSEGISKKVDVNCRAGEQKTLAVRLSR